MGLKLSLFTLFGAISTTIALVVAYGAWENREQRGAGWFMWTIIFMTLWVTSYSIQLSFTTLNEQIVWEQVTRFVGGFVPYFFLLFTLEYTGRGDLLTDKFKLGIAIPILLSSILTLTNSQHHLIWENVEMVDSAGVPILLTSNNWLFYLTGGYIYGLVGISVILLLRVFLSGSLIYQTQSGLLLIGCVFPTITNLRYSFAQSYGPLPPADLTPYAFVLTGLVFGLALFRFDLLDRTTIARERVIEEMGDGLLIVDKDGHVEFANSVVEDIYKTEDLLDLNVKDMAQKISSNEISEELSMAEMMELIKYETVSSSSTSGTTNSSYDTDLTELNDPHGELIGYVIVFRDITQRDHYQQQLEVTQRVLRHNLRNDMNIIQGWASQLEQLTNGSEAVTRITETATNLIDLSEKMRTMIEIEESPDKDLSYDPVPAIEETVSDFERDYEDTHININVETPANIAIPHEDVIHMPVNNLIENAIKHNDAERKEIDITITSSEETVAIHIQDNASEIPEMEKKVIKNQSENPLEHGSGIGLWLTHWGVYQADGQIQFSFDESSGNTVTLVYPGDRHAENGENIELKR